MKRNWTLFAAIIVLLFSVVANRASARYRQGMDDTHKQVKNDWDVMNSLIENATQEDKTYKTIRAQAAKIDDRITWESDSTNLLRWFDDLAKELNLHLAKSQVLPTRRRRKPAASVAFRPMRFELGLQGDYRALATYVARVESAPYALPIEKLSMNAVRNYFGAGDMHITVLCLMPVEMATEKKDGEGS